MRAMLALPLLLLPACGLGGVEDVLGSPGGPSVVRVRVVSSLPNGWGAHYQRNGTEGLIEVASDHTQEGQPLVRARVKDQAGWLEPEITPNDAFRTEIERLIDVLERGGRHPLDGRSARAGHEILMAAYESARRRARIDLPLDVPENPLEALVAEHGV